MGSACLRALVNVVLTLKKYKTFVVEAVLAAIDEVYDENGYIVPYFKRAAIAGAYPPPTGSSCPPPLVKHVENSFDSLDAATRFLVHTVRSSVIRNNLFLRHVALTPSFIDDLAQLRQVTWVEGCLQIQYVDSTAVSPLALIESFAQVGGLSCRDCKFSSANSLDDSFLKSCSEIGTSTILLHETASSISEDSIVDWISGRNDCHGMAYLPSADESPRTRVLKLWAPHASDDLFLNIVMAAHACVCDAPMVLVLCRLGRDLVPEIDWAFNGIPLNAESVELHDWNGDYPFYIFTFRDVEGRIFEVRWCCAEQSLVLIRDAETFARWGFPIENRRIDV
ncbi:hypothetical protein AAVH_13398 [Aphelenchoides avenae]|nr:hypothetical protein AAVH_13398 [Aphelenchus avenae]